MWVVALALGGLLVLGVPRPPEAPVVLEATAQIAVPGETLQGAQRMVISGRAHGRVHHLKLDGAAPSLDVRLEGAPRAGWAGSVRVRATGMPGDTVPLLDPRPTGRSDTVPMVLDEWGVGEAGIRIVPTQAAWQDWPVARMDTGDQGKAGSWVLDDGPPRVLVRMGPPTWESAFLVRSLEEAGARVQVRQRLGVGLELRGEGSAAEGPVEGVSPAVHVTIVLPDAGLTADDWERLAGDVRQRGAGLILIPDGPGGPIRGWLETLGWAVAHGISTVPAGGLEWELPPEVVALPPVDLEVEVAPMSGESAGSPVAFGPLGMGRLAVMGIQDSWRWRMEAGQVDAHRLFWRSLVEWAGGGAGLEGWVVPPSEAPTVGSPLPLVSFTDGREARLLPLAADTLSVAVPGSGAGAGGPAGPPGARVIAAPVRDAPLHEESVQADPFGDARLALALLQAPMGAVSGPDFPGVGASTDWAFLRALFSPLAVLLLLASVALGGWGWDRLRGRP